MKRNFLVCICLVLHLEFCLLYGISEESESHPDKWKMFHFKEPTADEANDVINASQLQTELQTHDSLLSELQKLTGALETNLKRKSHIKGREDKNFLPYPTTRPIDSNLEEDADKPNQEIDFNMNTLENTPSNETNAAEDGKEINEKLFAPQMNRCDLEDMINNQSLMSLKYNDFFVGTNLFGQYRKQTFSIEDIILLSIRKDFETLVPRTKTDHFLDENEVRLLLKYFYTIHNVLIGCSLPPDAKHLTKLAFYDMLGGYLHYSFLPLIKLSYYAGLLNQTTVDSTIRLYQQSKVFLNTNGNGWRESKIIIDNLLWHGKITPVIISDDFVDSSSCALLNLNETLTVGTDTRDSRMIISLPKLSVDCNGYLESIKLPYRSRNVFNIKSSMPVAILPRFYQNVIGCYRHQNLSPDFFNQKFKDWIVEDVYIHLQDKQFYPILGSVLKIMKTETSSLKGKLDHKPCDKKQEEPPVHEVIKAYKSKLIDKDNSHQIDLKAKSHKLLDLIRSSKSNFKKSSIPEFNQMSRQMQSEELNAVPYVVPSSHLEYYYPRPDVRTKNYKKYDDLEMIEKAYASAKFKTMYLIFGFAFVMGVLGLAFVLIRQYWFSPADDDETEHAAKAAANFKSNRRKCDLQHKSSPTVCQPGRKIIPLPFSNLGGRMANCDLSYYRSACDKEKKGEGKQRGKKKLEHAETSSWTTAYLFHK